MTIMRMIMKGFVFQLDFELFMLTKQAEEESTKRRKKVTEAPNSLMREPEKQ